LFNTKGSFSGLEIPHSLHIVEEGEEEEGEDNNGDLSSNAKGEGEEPKGKEKKALTLRRMRWMSEIQNKFAVQRFL